MFSEMQRTITNIIFLQGLPENLNDESFKYTIHPSLIVIDDLIRDTTNSKDVCELFVEGSHHRNISVAFKWKRKQIHEYQCTIYSLI
jgi:hypothetical protein